MKKNTKGLDAAQNMLQLVTDSAANAEAPGGYGGQAAVTAIIALEIMREDYRTKTFASTYIGEPYSLEEIGEWLESVYPAKLQEIPRLHADYARLIADAHARAAVRKTETTKEKELAEVQHYLKSACQMPLNVARACLSLLELAMAIYQESFPSAHGSHGIVLSLLVQAFLDACFSYKLNLSQVGDLNQRSKMERILGDLQQQYLAIREPVQERILAIALYP